MAIIPACHGGLSCNDAGLFAVIRASNTSSHSRWGDINLLGAITHNYLVDAELCHLEHFYEEGQNLLKPQFFISSVRRQFNHVTDSRAANEKQIFVPNGFCMLDQLNLRDSRPFFRTNRNEERQLCLVTITGPDPHSGPSIVCMEFDTFPQVFHKRELNCPRDMEIFHISRKFSMRNLVPLVHMSYTSLEYKVDAVWLMDVFGNGSPLIFPVGFSQHIDQVSEQHAYSLAGCEEIVGWRGSVPLVQVTPHVWVTIVHKLVTVPKHRKNKLGRRYVYRSLQLISDVAGGPPNRCALNRDEKGLRNLPKPFVYLLGFVHVGKVVVSPLDQIHRFMISGSIDDSSPFISYLDLVLIQL